MAEKKQKSPRSRMACVKCRTVKARCTVEGGTSCTRCTRLSFVCVFKPFPTVEQPKRASKTQRQASNSERGTRKAPITAPPPPQGLELPTEASSAARVPAGTKKMRTTYAAATSLHSGGGDSSSSVGLEGFMLQSMARVGLSYDSTSSLSVVEGGAAVLSPTEMPVSAHRGNSR